MDFVRRILVKDPNQRLGAVNFAEIKNHDYFKEIDWQNLRTSKVPFNQIKRPNRNLKTVLSNIDRFKVSGSFSKAQNDNSPLVTCQSPMESPLNSPKRSKLGSMENDHPRFGTETTVNQSIDEQIKKIDDDYFKHDDSTDYQIIKL